MTSTPDRYAVIGNPIAHSKSPEIHGQFAAQTGQNLVYERLMAPIDGFTAVVKDMVRQGYSGANVTVPFKLEACALATSLTERARLAGAVNTLKFESNAILGDNTDGIGLVMDIKQNADVPFAGKRVLLLGAGGAARGVVLPILQEHPEQLVIANRTADKAQALVQQFAQYGHVSCSPFEALQAPFDIVINATSASLANDVPPLAPVVFSEHAFAYDMMYGKEPTVFMCVAAEHGATVRDGLGMLVEQAAEAFFLWRGVRPETGMVLSALRASL